MPEFPSASEPAPGVQIRLEPGGECFSAAAGQTVLEAALAAGLRLPRSCRNGTCRTCMCSMTRGAVRYRVEWPGLLAEEKADGWILPCVAEPLADLVLQARPVAVRR